LSWADRRLRALSVDTTGGDDDSTRIVALGMVFIGDPASIDDLDLVINPGAPSPPQRAPQRGTTIERARTEGVPPADALRMVVDRLRECWAAGLPLIGFDATSTLTVLDREARRHLGAGLAVTGPVVDPHLIDIALGGCRGARSLDQTCRHYQVRHGQPHDPVQDAYAAARLAWRMARHYPRQVGQLSLPDLHRQQIVWAEQNHKTGWPLLPNSTVDPNWRPDVLDAIHTKIRHDWETMLGTSGPQPFRTEVHIVNDTPAAQPSFTSVRALPPHIGSNDAVIIASIGELAHTMAADRIVIAWEPRSLHLSTRSPTSPLPPAGPWRVLHILDVVVGTPARLSKYPYIPPTLNGETPLRWGTAETVRPPIEPLDPVIMGIIAFWREPSPHPHTEHKLRASFRRLTFELTETPRPPSSR
jgi:DNA polymerase-3 subunit epsilon